MAGRPRPVAQGLWVEKAVVRAGQFTILHGVDLRLHPGEFCGLVGPSGAGKSTLIKLILGTKAAASGEVRIGGRPVQDSGPLGYVPQDDALHRSLTVQQSLDFTAELRLGGMPPPLRRARIRQVCGQVGLEHRMNARIRSLSGGQRKRVSVALELLTAPPILILDEPTSGLDPGLEDRMMRLFRDLTQQGHVVLVATHAMQSLAMCDVLCVLAGGRVTYQGPPQEAMAWFGAPDFAALFSAVEADPLPWAQKWSGSAQAQAFARRPPPSRPPALGGAPMAAPSLSGALRGAGDGQARPPSPPKPSAEAQLAAMKAELARKRARPKPEEGDG